MNKWNKIEDGLPKYSDYYIVYCNIGSMLGWFKEVRSYPFDGKDKKWVIPNNFHEIVCITHWMDMPDEPEEE